MDVRRRSLLLTGAALAASGASATDSGPKPKSLSKKATYVLVHGGGHGGWCWQRVAVKLRAQGHEVYTPTMTGLGERFHLLNPSVDLDLHIKDMVNVLKYEDLTGVILVGHSYGGMVITGIADRTLDRVGQLVYLDAAHPKNGDSLVTVTHGGISSTRKTGRVVDGIELVTWPGPELLQTLGVTKPEDVAWLMKELTPHPWKCFEQPLKLDNEAAVMKIPKTDIWRSMVLRQLDPDGSKRAAMADRVWEIDSPAHDLMVTDPQPVADMLLRLATI